LLPRQTWSPNKPSLTPDNSGAFRFIQSEGNLLLPAILLRFVLSRRRGIAPVPQSFVLPSDKYLHSPYCMQELVGIYRHSGSDSKEFQRHIIPLVFQDARISDWRYRAEIAKHWSEEFHQMEQHVGHLGLEDLRLYCSMRDWHNRVGDLLAYIANVLAPRGCDEIARNNYAILRKMLSRKLTDS
jgi:hypothetical protein